MKCQPCVEMSRECHKGDGKAECDNCISESITCFQGPRLTRANAAASAASKNKNNNNKNTHLAKDSGNFTSPTSNNTTINNLPNLPNINMPSAYKCDKCFRQHKPCSFSAGQRDCDNCLRTRGGEICSKRRTPEEVVPPVDDDGRDKKPSGKLGKKVSTTGAAQGEASDAVYDYSDPERQMYYKGGKGVPHSALHLLSTNAPPSGVSERPRDDNPLSRSRGSLDTAAMPPPRITRKQARAARGGSKSGGPISRPEMSAEREGVPKLTTLESWRWTALQESNPTLGGHPRTAEEIREELRKGRILAAARAPESEEEMRGLEVHGMTDNSAQSWNVSRFSLINPSYPPSRAPAGEVYTSPAFEGPYHHENPNYPPAHAKLSPACPEGQVLVSQGDHPYYTAPDGPYLVHNYPGDYLRPSFTRLTPEQAKAVKFLEEKARTHTTPRDYYRARATGPGDGPAYPGQTTLLCCDKNHLQYNMDNTEDVGEHLGRFVRKHAGEYPANAVVEPIDGYPGVIWLDYEEILVLEARNVFRGVRTRTIYGLNENVIHEILVPTPKIVEEAAGETEMEECLVKERRKVELTCSRSPSHQENVFLCYKVRWQAQAEARRRAIMAPYAEFRGRDFTEMMLEDRKRRIHHSWK